MNKIIAVGIAMITFSGTAIAQSDASLTWSISGIDGLQELRLDVDFGTRFLPSNGVLIEQLNDQTIQAVPIAGTCFVTNTEGVFCTFSYQQGDTGVLDLQSSLNGTWRTVGVNGAITETGSVTLVDVF